jgi:hypothetical protein
MDNLKPTLKNAILAQCHQCMGYYSDGKEDYRNTKCPLYNWMPYRKLEPDLSWTQINPKRMGKIKLADIEISEAMRENARKMAEKMWTKNKENKDK